MIRFLFLVLLLLGVIAFLSQFTKNEDFLSLKCHDDQSDAEDVESIGLLLDNVGKDENDQIRLVNPYLEMNPKYFQSILDKFVASRFATIQSYEGNVYQKLQKAWSEWFMTEGIRIDEGNSFSMMINDRSPNDPSILFSFSDHACITSKTIRTIMYRKERSFGFVVLFELSNQKIVKATWKSILRQEDLLYIESANKWRVSKDTTTSSTYLDSVNQKLVPKEDVMYVSTERYDHDDSSDAKYSCYGDAEGNNVDRKYRCTSQFSLLGYTKQKGTWDRKCQINEDCPFYRKNTNYPNERGGCKSNGFCEMPINVDQKSPIKIDEEAIHNAYCYNCDAEDNEYKCCLSQERKRRHKYDLMSSPDYAFESDFLERQKNGIILTKRRLVP